MAQVVGGQVNAQICDHQMCLTPVDYQALEALNFYGVSPDRHH